MASVATTTATATPSQLPQPRSRASSIREPSTPFKSSIARPTSRNSIRSNGALSPLPSSSFSPASPTQAISPSSKSFKRRSSFEALASIAALNGTTSTSIPLPVARTPLLPQETIPEGIPIDATTARPTTPQVYRPTTPTRTISRIPVASVGHARTLADDGSSARSGSVSPLPKAGAAQGDLSMDLNDVSSSSLQLPISSLASNYRKSLGGTTKVLAELQAAALSARSSLENTKSQLRLSQRSVAQLTRQTEDLKDGRERLRLENESLNNVVARKERLLQEVLERARKAEAEVITLKTSLKTEQQNAKKSTATVTEAVAISQKSQREYVTLKDSIQSMQQGWKNEVKELREEMQKQDEGWRKEVEEVGLKYRSLVKLMQAANRDRAKLETMKTESETVEKDFEAFFRQELKNLHTAVEQSTRGADETGKVAANIAEELARLRRLMRSAATMQQHLEEEEPPS